MMFVAEETFWDLLHSSAHWQFEIFLMLIFDVGIGVVAWPLIKRAVRTHDARKHGHKHCDELYEDKVA